MVSAKKRTRWNKTYYYLEHHIGNRSKEIYLGNTIPTNIEEIKQDFMLQFYREEWDPKVKRIRQRHAKEMKTRPKSMIENDMKQFSINFTYHTQRIEGSTLTLRDTAMLLEEGMTPPNRPSSDVREAEAHRDVFFDMIRLESDLSLDVVCKWHKKLLQDSKPDIAGNIRNGPVEITGSKYIPPRAGALGYLLTSFFKWYKGKRSRSLNPVERAARVHLKFVSIHPFGGGNGRISRLMMNHTLYASEYPMLNIDYKDRRTYNKSLERAQLNEDELIFLKWFMRRYLKTYDRYTRAAPQVSTVAH